MELIPSIDILNGQVVRLHQGNYNKPTVFSDDPLTISLRWQALGAKRLHIIDLDGSAKGKPINLHLVEKIASQLRIPIQLGGGIRSAETIKRVLQAGVGRIIIGTKAVDNPAFIEDCIATFNNEGVIVAIDSQKDMVAIKGWREMTSVSATSLLNQMELIGVRRFLITDIDRDGTLRGPNLDLIRRTTARSKAKILAAGGIHTVTDLKELSYLKVEGAILGKALYSGTIDFAQALLDLS